MSLSLYVISEGNNESAIRDKQRSLWKWDRRLWLHEWSELRHLGTQAPHLLRAICSVKRFSRSFCSYLHQSNISRGVRCTVNQKTYQPNLFLSASFVSLPYASLSFLGKGVRVTADSKTSTHGPSLLFNFRFLCDGILGKRSAVSEETT